MSWSISAVGRPAAVAAKLGEDLAKIRCTEPEETIKGKVANIIRIALGDYPAETAVRVEACGSQWSPNSGSQPVNSLTLKIEPLSGFVE